MEELKNSDEQVKNYKWEREEEFLLKEWAEKAMCYKWLHTRANKKFSAINMKVTIPVIILSTITGTANFAQERIPEESKSLYVMCIGGLNILAGIITTIAQYFRISEINEGHRIASLSWDKFSRNIRIQLTKRPTNRESALTLMKYAKDEFDRLMEVSPDIPDEIIKSFKLQFDSKKNDAKTILETTYKEAETIPKEEVVKLIEMRTMNDNFIRPDICGKLSEIHIYTHSETDRENDNKTSVKENFILQFRQVRGRNPTQEEINEGLQVFE
jgi:hypothetical protein